MSWQDRAPLVGTILIVFSVIISGYFFHAKHDIISPLIGFFNSWVEQSEGHMIYWIIGIVLIILILCWIFPKVIPALFELIGDILGGLGD